MNNREIEHAWRASLEPGRAEWGSLRWQESPWGVRVQEWKRHLVELGIPFDSFRDQSILDVGCGPVGIVHFLDARRSVGLDPLADEYQQWNGYWGRRVELVQSVGENTPFRDSSFDTVFCINVLDHTFNPSAIVQEMHRVLKPKGMLILHVDLDSPLRKLHKAMRKSCRVLHPQSLSHWWLMRELQRYFEVVRVHRDPEVFRATWQQIRYEAYWDGLIYRLTRWKLFINHVWLKAIRRPV